jgi:hypothetical protein
MKFTVFSSVACYAACHAFPAHRLQLDEILTTKWENANVTKVTGSRRDTDLGLSLSRLAVSRFVI